MFRLLTLQDTVRIKPADLGRPLLDAVLAELDAAYLDKVIHDVGLVVATYDVQVRYRRAILVVGLLLQGATQRRLLPPAGSEWGSAAPQRGCAALSSHVPPFDLPSFCWRDRQGQDCPCR